MQSLPRKFAETFARPQTHLQNNVKTFAVPQSLLQNNVKTFARPQSLLQNNVKTFAVPQSLLQNIVKTIAMKQMQCIILETRILAINNIIANLFTKYCGDLCKRQKSCQNIFNFI